VTEKALNHLRQALWHRLKVWDEASAAEKELGVEIRVSRDDVDRFCAGVAGAETVLTLSAEDLRKVFKLENDPEAQ
jgi:hypothetical protein